MDRAACCDRAGPDTIRVPCADPGVDGRSHRAQGQTDGTGQADGRGQANGRRRDRRGACANAQMRQPRRPGDAAHTDPEPRPIAASGRTRSGDAAPAPIPEPVVIAVERSDEATLVVPAAPSVPTPVIAAAPSASSPETVMLRLEMPAMPRRS